MKKKTALHWDYRAETRGTIKYLLALCLFGGLMLWSALYMLYDLFPEFRLNGKGVLLAELSAAALVLFHRGFLRYAQRKRIPVLSSLWILAPVSGIYLLGFLLCYLTNRKILTDGTLGIGAVFLKAWNSYYKTALPLPKQNTAAIPEALAFWLLLLFTVFWLLAEIWQKALFLTALPVTALAAGLLVGKAPGWQGIALFVFGILLEEAGEGEHYAANRLKRKEIHRLRQQTVPRLAVLLVCLVMLLTAEHLFSRPVGQLMEKSPDMLKFQKNLETQLTSAFVSPLTTNRENVSNRTPEYSGREVMTVELSQKPEGSVYLRNFYGTDYEDGSWNCDLASFQSAAEKEGFDPTEAALVVSGHPGQILLEQKEEELEYRISYRRGLGREAALPYYIYPEESDGLSFFGEGRAKRKLFSGKLAFRGSYLADGELMDLEMFALDTEPDDEEREILNWYDGYARNYLQDSDRVPSAADPYLFYPYYDYVSENDLAGVKPYLQNWERIYLASVVCDSLRQKCSYHLKLQPLPDGMDAVEYFLSESQEGYCMHFASAGTLLLRAFGVPARYASGYIVKRSEFEQGSDGKFTASVKDWNAHAWTEIYLDGIGWVPIEMTPGYEPGRSSLPTVSDGDDRTDSVSEPESESENTRRKNRRRRQKRNRNQNRKQKPRRRRKTKPGEIRHRSEPDQKAVRERLEASGKASCMRYCFCFWRFC